MKIRDNTDITLHTITLSPPSPVNGEGDTGLILLADSSDKPKGGGTPPLSADELLARKHARFDAALIQIQQKIPISNAVNERSLAHIAAQAFVKIYERRDVGAIEDIFYRAVQELKTRFEPEKAPSGNPPTDAVIRAALAAGYRDSLQQRGLGETEKREIELLLTPFAKLIKAYKVPLKLAGTSEVLSATAKKSGLPGPEATARRLLLAIATYLAFPSLPLSAETIAFVRAFFKFDRNVPALASHLMTVDARSRALRAADEILAAQEEMQFRQMVTSAQVSPQRIETYFQDIEADIEEWLRSFQKAVQFAPQLLKDFVRDYITFWLSELGEAPPRLTYLPEAKMAAVKKTLKAIDPAGVKHQFELMAGQLISFIIRLEFKHQRLADGPSGNKVDITFEGGLTAINTPEEFEAVLGGLSAPFNLFFDELKGANPSAQLSPSPLNPPPIKGGGDQGKNTDVSRNAVAAAFYELFVNYICAGANIYGKRFNEEFIRKNGLQAELVQAAFKRSLDTTLFTDDALTSFREFFIRNTDSAPDISQLRPAPVQARQRSALPASNQFVNYTGGGMDELIDALPFRVDAQEFEEATGIPLKRFRTYGSIRNRPPVMTRHIWQTLVTKITPTKALPDLLKSYFPEEEGSPSPFPPPLEGGGAQVRVPSPLPVPSEVEGMGEGQGEGDSLRQFALENMPTELHKADWQAFVNHSVQIDRLEYVSAEPRDSDSFDAILPAYEYLQKKAMMNGTSIDPIDFLAALSAVIRRMREHAGSEGEIFVEILSFLSDVPFQNLHYPILARRVQKLIKDKRLKLHVDVLEATIAKHASGSVENPEFATLVKYAESLASATTGAGVEKEGHIYELLAGIFRWLPVIESIAPVYNISGGKESYAPDGINSRFRIFFVPANDAFIPSKGEASQREADALFRDIRRGKWSTMLEGFNQYYQSIESLGKYLQIELVSPEQEAVEPLKILALIRSAEKKHRFYRTMARNKRSSGISLNDIKMAEVFYAGLREFIEEGLFFTRVRGTVKTKRASIHVEIAPRLKGRKYAATRDGRVVLFIDDAYAAAKRDGWKPSRLKNQVTLRAILSRLALEGVEQDKIKNIALQWWPARPEDFEEAFSDHLALVAASPERQIAVSTAYPLWSVQIEKERSLREPFISHRRKNREWADQLKAFAASRGLEENVADAAVNAAREYFREIKIFYYRFWDQALHHAVETSLGEELKEKAGVVFDAIVDFFPRIGVENGRSTPSVSIVSDGIDTKSLTESLAKLAVDEYAEFFPIDPTLPVKEVLLHEIVNRFYVEHASFGVHVSQVYERAVEMIHEHNVVSEPAAALNQRTTISLPVNGLLGILTDDPALKSAFLTLRPHLNEGDPGSVIPAEVSAAPAASYWRGDPVNDMQDLLSKRANMLALWKEMLTDGQNGIVQYFKGHFERRRFIREEKLLQFAADYFDIRLSQIVPLEIDLLSREAVADDLGVFEDIAVNISKYYQLILERFIDDLWRRYSGKAATLRDAIDLIAEEKKDTLLNTTELVSETLAFTQGDTGITNPEELGEFESRLALIAQIVGRQTDGTITTYADSLFAKMRAQRIGAERARLDQIATAVADKNKTITDFIERVLQLSAAHYLTVELDGLNEPELKGILKELAAGLEIFERLQDELPAILRFAQEAMNLASEFETTPFAELQRPEIVREAKETSQRLEAARPLLDQIESKFISRDEEVKQRLSRFESARQVNRMADISRQMNEASASFKTLLEGLKDTAAAYTRYRMAYSTLSLPSPIKGEGDKEIPLQTAGRDLIENYHAFVKLANDAEMAVEDSLHQIGEALSRRRYLTSLLKDARHLIEGGPKVGEKEALRAAFATFEHRFRTLEALMESYAQILRYIEKTKLETEKSLPVGSVAKYPARTTLDVHLLSDMTPIEGGRILFNTAAPAETATKKPSEAVKWFLETKLLSIENNSYLIKAETIASVERWMENGRGKPLAIYDIFGNKIDLKALAEAVRTDPVSKAPATHPLRRIVDALTNVMAENSYEADVVSTVLGRLSNMKGGLGLFFDLCGVFAEFPSPSMGEGQGEGEQLIVRGWAFHNRERLAKLVPDRAAKWFITELDKPAVAEPATPAAPATAAANNIPSYKTPYGPAQHAALRDYYAFALREPHLATLLVLHGGGQVESHHIEIEDVEAGQKSHIFRTIEDDGSRGIYDGTKLPDSSFAIPHYPVAASNMQLKLFRLLYRIYNDPELADLGYLLREVQRKGTPPEFKYFLVEQMLMPLVRSEGQTFPVPLFNLQNDAVNVYNELKANPLLFSEPEVARVKKEVLDKWLDSMPEPDGDIEQQRFDSLVQRGLFRPDAKLKELRPFRQGLERIKKFVARSPSFRMTMALNHLMSESDEELKGQIPPSIYTLSFYFRDPKATDKDLLGKIKMIDIGTDNFINTLRSYQSRREQILRDRRFIQGATGLARPELSSLGVHEDEGIAKGHPETAKVGYHQKIATMLSISKEKGLERVVRSFPELSGTFTIIITVGRHMGEKYTLELSDLLRGYLASKPEDITEEDVARFKQRIISFYEEHADAIRKALSGTLKGDMTHARYLTGEDEPWRPDAEGWDGVPMIEKARATVPEAFLIKPEAIKLFTELLIGNIHSGKAKSEDVAMMKGLLKFIGDFKELRGPALLQIFMVSDEANTRALKNFFIDYQSATDVKGKDEEFLNISSLSLPLIRLAMLDRLTMGDGELALTGNRYAKQNYENFFIALLKRLGAREGQTVAEVLTGTKEPWLPQIEVSKDPSAELLPLSDLDRLDKMTADEIDEKVMALGLLPTNAKELSRMITSFDAKLVGSLWPTIKVPLKNQYSKAEFGRLMKKGKRRTFEDTVYSKLQIVIDMAGLSKVYLNEMVKRSLHEKSSGFKSASLHFAYQFVLEHREEILRVTKGAVSPGESQIEGPDEATIRARIVQFDILPRAAARVKKLIGLWREAEAKNIFATIKAHVETEHESDSEITAVGADGQFARTEEDFKTLARATVDKISDTWIMAEFVSSFIASNDEALQLEMEQHTANEPKGLAELDKIRYFYSFIAKHLNAFMKAARALNSLLPISDLERPDEMTVEEVETRIEELGIQHFFEKAGEWAQEIDAKFHFDQPIMAKMLALLTVIFGTDRSQEIIAQKEKELNSKTMTGLQLYQIFLEHRDEVLDFVKEQILANLIPSGGVARVNFRRLDSNEGGNGGTNGLGGDGEGNGGASDTSDDGSKVESAPLGGYENDRSPKLSPILRRQLEVQDQGSFGFVGGARAFVGYPSGAGARAPISPVFIVP